MAELHIIIDLPMGRLLTHDEALAIADHAIDRAGLRNTPDLGHKNGNTSGIRHPFTVSRWAVGEFSDGYVHVDVTE